MSSVVRGSTTTRGTSRYGLASEAYRTRSIALWRTFSFPRIAMRSAFRSPGVPSTREAGTASLVGGPSNRPIRAGFAENSFLIMAVPSTLLFKLHLVEKVRGPRIVCRVPPLLPRRTNCGLVALNIFQSGTKFGQNRKTMPADSCAICVHAFIKRSRSVGVLTSQLEQLQFHSRRTLTNANRRLLLAIGTNCFLLLKKPPCHEDHSKHLTA